MQSYEREEEQEQQQQINDTKPALLCKSELQLLLGNVKFSKPFEYKMKNKYLSKYNFFTPYMYAHVQISFWEEMFLTFQYSNEYYL